MKAVVLSATMALSSFYGSIASFASDFEDDVRIESEKLDDNEEKNYETVSDLPEYYQSQLSEDGSMRLYNIVDLSINVNNHDDLSWLTKCEGLQRLEICLTEQIDPEILACLMDTRLVNLEITCGNKVYFDNEEDAKLYFMKHDNCKVNYTFESLEWTKDTRYNVIEFKDIELTDEMFAFLTTLHGLDEITINGLTISKDTDLSWISENCRTVEKVVLNDLKFKDGANSLDLYPLYRDLANKAEISVSTDTTNLEVDVEFFNQIESLWPIVKGNSEDICVLGNYNTPDYVYTRYDRGECLSELRLSHDWIYKYKALPEISKNISISFEDSISEKIKGCDLPIYLSKEEINDLLEKYNLNLSQDELNELNEVNKKLDSIVNELGIREDDTDQQKLDKVLFYVCNRYNYDGNAEFYPTNDGVLSQIIEKPINMEITSWRWYYVEIKDNKTYIYNDDLELEDVFNNDSNAITRSDYAIITCALLRRVGVEAYSVDEDNLVKIGDYYYGVTPSRIDRDKSLRELANVRNSQYYMFDPYSEEIKAPANIELIPIPEEEKKEEKTIEDYYRDVYFLACAMPALGFLGGFIGRKAYDYIIKKKEEDSSTLDNSEDVKKLVKKNEDN